MQSILPKLYEYLGGTHEATSPVTLKGGAAFVVYMSREVCIHRDKLPPSLLSFEGAADLDFASTMTPPQMLEAVAAALPWFTDASVDIWPLWAPRCPQWRLRFDRQYGEAFFDGKRHSLGRDADTSASYPIKVTFTGGLSQRHDGRGFQLVRIGPGLWHQKLRRAAVAAFVDISLDDVALPTVRVMGLRVQSPASMLKTLRRMTFHEVAYEPWLAAYGDESKQQRRLERLLKMSFLEDWKTMGGIWRGKGSCGACNGLQARWSQAIDFLITRNDAALRRLATSSPPQLRFFALCSARMLETAEASSNLDECDWWVDRSAVPLMAELLA